MKFMFRFAFLASFGVSLLTGCATHPHTGKVVHLLNHKDSLNLTADQVSKLTAIRDSAKAAHDAAGSDFKTHMDELSQAFQTASPDTAALRPHFDAAHAAMGKAHWAMLSAAARARALLTDAQRQKVDAAVAAMSQREHM